MRSGVPFCKRAELGWMWTIMQPFLHFQRKCFLKVTLQATRCGQNFPKPRGGWIRLNKVTTSRCLMRPLRKQQHVCLFLSTAEMELHLVAE